ncbi:cellulase-like family protein [uncultured Cellulomonas sp.]|uniref:cellulase-like family protein n=1 Tax=uncultured Cellulomonas sp. TaxID=189682 RepID=UPI00260276F8|nr:cellulase-like family protein [uncultured Cellulomonas sp.]
MTTPLAAVPAHLPDRLAITLWDFSWYVRTGPGEPFEDLDAAFTQARDRGYNAVRICAMPFLVFRSGLDTTALRLGPIGNGYAGRVRWYDVAAPTTIDARTHLLELFRAADRHGMVVIASSWEYQQSPAFAADRSWYDALHAVEPDDRLVVLGEALADLVDLLVEHGLGHTLAFVEPHNEVQAGHLTVGLPGRADPVVELKDRLEAGIAAFSARHPDVLCGPNYAAVPVTAMRGLPDNAGVLVVHPYVYGVLDDLVGEFALRGDPADFPQERADAELLRPGAPRLVEWAPPADEEWKRHASIVGHAEIYVHDWCDPAAVDRWQYERYGAHRIAMANRLEEWIGVAADHAARLGIPLVLGEGWVGYTPRDCRFEEGPVGAQICRDAVRHAARVGAWGSVVCSNAAPHHAMWADAGLQRECNAVLLGSLPGES